MLIQTARDWQQNFYEITSDWNVYTREEHKFLKDFIGYALFGPPDFKDPVYTNDSNDSYHHFRYTKEKETAVDLIFAKVIECGTKKEGDGSILCGIIYNVIFNNEKPKDAKKTETNEEPKNNNTTKDSNKTKEIKESESNKTLGDSTKSEENKESKNGETTKETGEKVGKVDDAPQVYPVPVFKVKGYEEVKTKGKDKNNKTITVITSIERTYYIDNDGRVYDAFADYLSNNKLPKCTMVLPKDGMYQAIPQYSLNPTIADSKTDQMMTKVWIEVHDSPACGIGAKVATGVDVISTVVTFASMGVGLAALMTPVGAGIAVGSAVGAGLSGLWTAGRCTQQLVDRGQHKESINVTNKTALGAWIGVAGGGLGAAATGSSALLGWAVRTGANVGKVARGVFNGVQIGNLIVNGVGIGFRSYDIYEIYSKEKTVHVKDVLFFTAHVFFFCNSVVNVKLAQNLIETTQGEFLKDYEASLRSNRHRKEFQRMARNTRAAGDGDVSTNQEIIRALNKISNKDEFFQAMVRNRKTLSASGAKATFSSNGKVTVNGLMTIDPIEFASLPKNVRTDIVNSVSSVQFGNNSTLKPPPVGNNQVSYANFKASSNSVLQKFCSDHSTALLQVASAKIGDFAHVLEDLQNVKNRSDIFLKLLTMGWKILQAMPRDEEITVGDTLAFVVQFLWDYVKINLHNWRPGMMIEDPSVQVLLNGLVRNLLVRVENKVDFWVEAFMKWLKKEFPRSVNGPLLNSPRLQ